MSTDAPQSPLPHDLAVRQQIVVPCSLGGVDKMIDVLAARSAGSSVKFVVSGTREEGPSSSATPRGEVADCKVYDDLIDLSE
jgi:hypothetical protein